MNFNKGLDLNQLMENQAHSLVEVYLRDGLRGLEGLLKLIETQKQSFRHLIKEKTGKNVRKTPRRRNNLVELENKLCAINIAFENEEGEIFEEESMGKATATQLLKSNGVVLCEVGKQHAACAFDVEVANRMVYGRLLKTPDVFNTPMSSKHRPIQKPSSGTRSQKQNHGFLEKDDPIISQMGRQTRSATRAVKKKADLPVITSSRLVQKPVVKKSDLMRQLEAKQKAVISNKEEMIKIKAERARRDREERAQRVLQNNKRKQEQREAVLRAIRQRELAVEELRRYQASPAKVCVKTVSRANSKSPSRLHLTQAASTRVPNNASMCLRPNQEHMQLQDHERVLSPQPNPLKRRPTAASPVVPLKRNTVQTEKQIQEFPSNTVVRQTSLERSDGNAEVINYQSSKKTNDDCGLKIDDPIIVTDKLENAEIRELQSSLRPSIVSKPFDLKSTNGLQPEQKDYHSQNKLIANGTAKKNVVTPEEKNKCTKKPSLQREREEAREKLGILDSSQLNNKNLMNVTACSSYEITPPKKVSPSTEDNYNIDDLSSGDETDEEDNPKKKIPSWAQPANLRRALREQFMKPLYVMDDFFGEIETPDLNKIFSVQRSRYAKRTSSAQWNSPLTNPREGVSMYYALQKQK